MPSGGHRRLRRAAALAAAVVVGLAAVVGLMIVINSRDSATFSSDRGPGREFADLGHAHLRAGQATRIRYNSDPPTSGPHLPAPVVRDGTSLDDDQILHALEAGNVVLVYSRRALGPALRRLADDLAGPFDPGVAAAGQTVILDRDAARPQTGVTAVAWRHLQHVSSPSDPALRNFVEYWLGRGVDAG